jgi:gamma-glutamyltranspeptidase / glutathione hydrolase
VRPAKIQDPGGPYVSRTPGSSCVRPYDAMIGAMLRIAIAATLALLAEGLVVATQAPLPVVQTAPVDVREYQGVATGRHGAVASAEANASDIGLAVLKRGGNAVDAAVAVAFALGVTHPSAGNIGGGGFMVIRRPDGTSTTIDYREVAPAAATRDMYLDAEGKPTDESRLGPRAAGIPGVVRGLALAHRKYGRLRWRELVQPAVGLARDGWALDTRHALDLAEATRTMDAYAARIPGDKGVLREAMAATLRTFRKPDGTAYAKGDVWKQPELAATLEAIARGGAAAFYRGPLARTMAQRVAAMGGLWTAADLERYRAIERRPIRFTYHGHEILTMPPPSSGGVNLRQILAASDALHLERLSWDSVDRIHLYVETLRRIYADSTQLLGDPGFVDVPLTSLLDTGYIPKRMADIDPAKATPSSAIRAGVAPAEHLQTTHFSVIDRDGMAVANTFTLNGDFGAKLQIPGTGVTLNNEMDDFTARPGVPNMFGLVMGAQNAIQPGKRMLSSMTPTIVVKDGKVRAIVGSPGGPTIITTVAQIVLQLIDHRRPLVDAVGAVRIHHQWLPDEVAYEEGLPEATIAALRARGHALKSRRSIGFANCIEVDPRTGTITAVADVKRDGGRASAY